MFYCDHVYCVYCSINAVNEMSERSMVVRCANGREEIPADSVAQAARAGRVGAKCKCVLCVLSECVYLKCDDMM
jgi:hypothetical protein